DMSKEEVISRFIALKFNPLLEYYHNSTDLNASVAQEIKESKKSRGKGEDEPKKSRRQMRVADKGDTIRLKINRGKRDGFEPKRLLGLINDVTGDRSIKIGDIDLSPKFTFFDVDKRKAAKLISAFETSPKAKGVVVGYVKGDR
ncbi:MAG: DbpA RNA binding domain-containing protein, partial [Paludibacteraceae bacterium]|nr:DbpA RNA binding domain-containing protein [Paludibacteraceae bacterium]